MKPSVIRPSVPLRSVEERLRIVHTQIDALQAIAHLCEESPTAAPLPVLAPSEHAPRPDLAFVKWAGQMAVSLREQVDAIAAALPDRCGNIEAPLVVGGAQLSPSCSASR
jgi:hypothetical protein